MTPEQSSALQQALKKRITPKGKDYAIYDIDVQALATLFNEMPRQDVYAVYKSLSNLKGVVDQYQKQLSAVEKAAKEFFTRSLSVANEQNIKFEDGTVIARTKKRSMKIEDPTEFYNFVLDNIESAKQLGAPIMDGFSVLGKTVTVAALEEVLHAKVIQSLNEDPYVAGSEESRLSFDDQVKARTAELASNIGVVTNDYETVSIRK